jgi:hypothetical protein
MGGAPQGIKYTEVSKKSASSRLSASGGSALSCNKGSSKISRLILIPKKLGNPFN